MCIEALWPVSALQAFECLFRCFQLKLLKTTLRSSHLLSTGVKLELISNIAYFDKKTLVNTKGFAQR
ncbi:hypothetical protein Y1Q_0013998 [Alligator mississippiensis]|uniref:Uncharacterized protein n=1 Tax=Alligator mississippiensis TaxID=8496 RepID=A0A151PDG1_ALLMI|nr:hypothetical protein Y1Q_0013998 [Alligator mississippiensis]